MQKKELRDQFAMAAMQALITNTPHVKSTESEGNTLMEEVSESGWGGESDYIDEDGSPMSHAEGIALEAYVFADAMLKMRSEAHGVVG